MNSSIRSARMTLTATLVMFSWSLRPAPAAAQVPNEACSLLSKADAAAALGEAAAGPRATGPMSDGAGSTVSACEYTGAGVHSIQLSVTRLPATSLPMYKAMICDKKGKDGLAGLGDLACWYNDKHAELHVIKGGSFISIELHVSGNPTQPIIGAMKQAVAKLK